MWFFRGLVFGLKMGALLIVYLLFTIDYWEGKREQNVKKSHKMTKKRRKNEQKAEKLKKKLKNDSFLCSFL